MVKDTVCITSVDAFHTTRSSPPPFWPGRIRIWNNCTGSGSDPLLTRESAWYNSLLQIHDILVWIRIRGSMPLTYGLFVIDLQDANKN
jgi:hypothetical protein